MAAEIPGPRARQRPKAQQRRRKNERQKTSLKNLWKLTSRRSLSTRARTRCSVASRAGWESTNKTQPVNEDQQKASAIVSHQICSLEAGERREKDPAGIADQMQFPSASLWHTQLGGKEEPPHSLSKRIWRSTITSTAESLYSLHAKDNAGRSGMVKKSKRNRSKAWLKNNLPCHVCCHRHGTWKMAFWEAGTTKLMRQVHATSARAFTSRCHRDACPQG